MLQEHYLQKALFLPTNFENKKKLIEYKELVEEAKKRGKKVGLLIIDLEAQYKATIDHINEVVEKYKDHIDLHWFCGELLLRNAVSDYEPKWVCWDESKKAIKYL